MIHTETSDGLRHRIRRQGGMRTDVVIYASEKLLQQIREDLSLQQAMNVATLPGIVGPSLAMPDIHQGYGFPIGGVAATDYQEGVVSPGGVGFDINCGVRLVTTNLTVEEVRPRLEEIVNQLFRDVPCGAGHKGRIKLNDRELSGILTKGAGWMVDNGYGEAADLECTEEQGCLAGADPDEVSPRAKERGRLQLGTLGSGNHFLEIQYVEQIHDREAARVMRLEIGQVVVLLHCGSRGLGHQVCTDFLARMGPAMKRHGITLPDRQLACVPIQSEEGRAYLGAMRAAANFAWANRQAILHFIRGSFERLFGSRIRLTTLYDVCHNIANRDVPRLYREIGQPVLIPGSMGTASWVLAGAEGARKETFGSVCHGAGRLLSRTAARKGRNAKEVKKQLGEQGIVVRSETRSGILEEVPEAYKDVDEVIDVVDRAGLARKVARLRPLGVIKG